MTSSSAPAEAAVPSVSASSMAPAPADRSVLLNDSTARIAPLSMNSRARGTTRPEAIFATAESASAGPGNQAASVRTASGSGKRRSVISVTIPRVPSEPTRSRVRS